MINDETVLHLVRARAEREGISDEAAAVALLKEALGGRAARGEAVRDYDTDFAAWACAQAHMIRTGRFADLDGENVAEELESLGRGVRTALRGHLTTIMVHLARLRIARGGAEARLWRERLVRARLDLEAELSDNASLAADAVLADLADAEWPDARHLAAVALGLDEAALPRRRPFTVDQIRSLDWLPDGRGGGLHVVSDGPRRDGGGRAAGDGGDA